MNDLFQSTYQKKDNFQYEITNELGVLSQYGDMTKEVKMVKYNGRDAKLDIRNWQHGPEGDRMRKGITLNREEARTLRDILNGIEI